MPDPDKLNSDDIGVRLPLEPRSQVAPTSPLSPRQALSRSTSPKQPVLQDSARSLPDSARSLPESARPSLASAAKSQLGLLKAASAFSHSPSVGGQSAFCQPKAGFRLALEGDNQPPKTGLDLPLIWAPPSQPVHDAPEPEPLLRALSSAEREVQVAEARAVEKQTVLRRLVFAVDDSGGASADSRPETPRAGTEARPLPPWCRGSLAPRGESDAPRASGWQLSLPPFYECTAANDETLVFESRFESGNLRRAWQIGPRAYELDLYPDRSTDLHTRWFYFSVANTRPGVPYTFLVTNMSVSSKSSMYHDGMQPVALSARAQRERGDGWRRSGTEVLYYSNGKRREARRRGCFHTLRFVLEFEFGADTVSVAPCVPYTYSQLKQHLRLLSEDPTRAYRMRRRRLCSTLAGNACEVVTVTSFDSKEDDRALPLSQRRGVVVTARAHPGEPQASWMMQGLLEFLTGPSLAAKQLRDHFVFKLVPSLNPDGVVVGNQRVNLSGADLNRRRTLHGAVGAHGTCVGHAHAHARAHARAQGSACSLSSSNPLQPPPTSPGGGTPPPRRCTRPSTRPRACCGSYRGTASSSSSPTSTATPRSGPCSSTGTAPAPPRRRHRPAHPRPPPRAPRAAAPRTPGCRPAHPGLPPQAAAPRTPGRRLKLPPPAPQAQRLGERMLPWIMQQGSNGTFAYDHCKFKVEAGKTGSARVVVALELQVGLSYTIEASYAGPKAGPHRDAHFSTRQLCAQGELLGLSLLQLCDVATLRRTFDELLKHHHELLAKHHYHSSSSSGGSGSSDDDVAAPPTTADPDRSPRRVVVSHPTTINTKEPARPYSRPVRH